MHLEVSGSLSCSRVQYTLRALDFPNHHNLLN